MFVPNASSCVNLIINLILFAGEKTNDSFAESSRCCVCRNLLPATLARPVGIGRGGGYVELPNGIATAYDPDNADELKRTIIGSGVGNRIDVLNATVDEPVVTGASSPFGEGISYIICVMVAVAALGAGRTFLPNAPQLLFGGSSRTHARHIGVFAAMVSLFGVAAVGGVISSSALAETAASLTISNHVTGSYSSFSYAFPMRLSVKTPDTAPAQASYEVALADGSTRTLTVSDHMSDDFSFALAHDDELSVSGLPVGTVWRFEQTGTVDDIGIEYSPQISYQTD